MTDLLRHEIARTLTRAEAASDTAERAGATHWVDELAERRVAIEQARERWRRGTATDDELRTMLAGARALIAHISDALGST